MCLSLSTVLVYLVTIHFVNAFVPPRRCGRQNVAFHPRFEASPSRDAIDWLRKEPVDSLLPKEEALSIISELLANEELIDESEKLVSTNWEKLETRLRDETRSAQVLLGQEVTDRILASVENVEGYDPDAVRAFLTSDAVNSLFARILYDGIFEFFQVIDVFGNIVNSLPIIGPIRKQIVVETKRQLDKSLGPLVQNFLQTYTKIAVVQASEFILSPANQKAFGGANVRLVSSLLERPLNSLLPPSDLSEKLIDDAYGYLRNANMTEVERYLGFVYDFAGDKSVDSFADVNRVLDASPTLQKAVDRIWDGVTSASSK